MRVIGGKYRSRLLNAPKGRNTRPTLDKVKESIFNIIGPRIDGSIVLDLFSGSGGLGIEALSRGASFAYFNDHDYSAYSCIKSNLESLKIDQSFYELTKMDYKKRISTLENKIDILFLDPPYKERIYQEIIEKMKENNRLSEQAIIVIECELDVEVELNDYSQREYRYGNKKLIILNLV